MKPPPSPEDKLRRVLRTAKVNGLSVVIIASLGALGSLLFGDLVGTAVGVVVAYGGWTELTGQKQLLRGEVEGMRQLVRAQWIVLGAIVVYCVTRLASFDSESVMGNLTPAMRAELTDAGVDMSAILPMVQLLFYVMYFSVALVTVIYQGGMAIYYRRRTAVVGEALAARLRPVSPPPLLESNPEDWVT